MGFSRPRGGVLAGVGIGFLVGVGALVLGLPANVLSAYVLDALGRRSDPAAQEQLMRGLVGWVAESPGVAIPASVLVVVVIGPAVEEFVFRGVVFNGLYRLGRFVSGKLGAYTERRGAGERVAFGVSAVVSSAFFASLHLEPAIFLALFILTVGLCALFRGTGSLLPPIVAHVTFNSFAVLVTILSGLGVFPAPS